jgi:hypothetical protein
MNSLFFQSYSSFQVEQHSWFPFLSKLSSLHLVLSSYNVCICSPSLKFDCSKREILPLGEMRELRELTLMPQAPPACQFRRPWDPPPWATSARCRESADLGHHRASLGELALAGLGLELEMNEGARDGRETEQNGSGADGANPHLDGIFPRERLRSRRSTVQTAAGAERSRSAPAALQQKGRPPICLLLFPFKRA